jgi:hypothetical protein
MPLQRLAESREADDDDASCHGNRPFIHVPNPRWLLSGTPDNAFSVQRADSSSGQTSAIALMLQRFV